MVRRALILVLLAGVFAAPASAASIRGQVLVPGVVYSRQLEFTSHGPVVLHVISAPKPTGLYALKPVLSNNALIGRERVTAMQRNVSAVGTVAGVNGDLFNVRDGYPTGALIRAGVLDSAPSDSRSSIGIDADGILHVERVQFAGTWQGTGQRRPLDINTPPRAGRTTLYTSVWGPTTPAEGGTVQATLQPFQPTAPNTAIPSTVAQAVEGGGQPIPPGGAILVARGAQAGFLGTEAPVGSPITIRLSLTPPWTGVTEALGGGPIVVRRGKPVFRSFELFSTSQLATRTSRTGVGQTADGRIVLVAVDGRQPGYSTGLTNFELALAMMRLGCVTASALDAGGSTTMAFDGKLLNRPSDPGGERSVAEALLLFYYGVYASPPLTPVLSPNGDGFGEAQTLSYKLVRQSTVTATLNGPGGAVVPLDSGARAPGVYRFPWSGAGQPEGAWTFNVTADDDQGQHSTAARQFGLNTTLGFVTARAKGRRVTAAFRLARPARVVTRVETLGGSIVRTLPTKNLPAGQSSVTWRGPRGTYVLSLTATNELGAVEQTALFRLRGR